MPTLDAPRSPVAYSLFFGSMFVDGRGYAFPCNADGRVALESFSATLRRSFADAQRRVGRELRAPVVRVEPRAN